jgi:phosphoglycolate phosphatase
VTLIALDLDGTLEDSRVDMVAAVQRIRHRLNLESRPDADFRSHVNRGMPHLYSHCFSEHLGADPDPESISRLRVDYESDYGAHIADNTVLYPGIKEAVVELQTLGRLALVTNKPESLSRTLLSALGLTAFFTTIIGGDTAAAPKPSPAALEEAALRTGRRMPAIMIGDSPGDIRCGKAFGATVVWCAWGYHESPGEADPEFIAQTPADLVRVVRHALGCC